MSGVDIGAINDFADGRTHIVLVDGRELAVLRWGERWFAMRNICPHRGAALCDDGGIAGPTLGEPVGGSPDLLIDADRPVLRCPRHRWEFDLASGRDRKGQERLRTYPVELSDGRVLVQLSEGGPPQAPRNVTRAGAREA